MFESHAFDGDDVEPGVEIGQIVVCQPDLGGNSQPFLFALIDRAGSTAVARSTTRFHLAEHDQPIESGDQVDLR